MVRIEFGTDCILSLLLNLPNLDLNSELAPDKCLNDIFLNYRLL